MTLATRIVPKSKGQDGTLKDLAAAHTIPWTTRRNASPPRHHVRPTTTLLRQQLPARLPIRLPLLLPLRLPPRHRLSLLPLPLLPPFRKNRYIRSLSYRSPLHLRP